MKSEKFNCIHAKQINLVEYLAKLGYHTTKTRNSDYWYFSPLRDEKEPSFKVNRKMNAWYDHGMGNGGNIIVFGILYHCCSVKELLVKMSREDGIIFSFQPPPASEKKETPGNEHCKDLNEWLIKSAEKTNNDYCKHDPIF